MSDLSPKLFAAMVTLDLEVNDCSVLSIHPIKTLELYLIQLYQTWHEILS